MKIIKWLGKALYIIWGVYAFLIVIADFFQSLDAVYNKAVQIENIFWYFGLIPTIYFLFFFFSKILFKKSMLFKKFVRLLGFVAIVLLIWIQFTPVTYQFSVSWPAWIVILFIVVASIKSFKELKKSKND
jgi:hypothetical protein